MPYLVNQNWYLPTTGAETLKDLAFRASLNGFSTGKISVANLEHLPRDLQFDFHEITNITHSPSVMRLREGHTVDGLDNLNIVPKIPFKYDATHIHYSYFDTINGRKRYNIISEFILRNREISDNPLYANYSLNEFINQYMTTINNIEYDTINFVEVKRNHITLDNWIPAKNDSAINFSKAISSFLKKPVTYHTYQTDVFSEVEIINSNISTIKSTPHYTVAGIKKLRSGMPTAEQPFSSTSFLVGSEYSPALCELFL